MSERKIACILAINKAGTIGHAGKLPWHLPDDLARFKRVVSGNTMVIGRVTHESLQEFREAAVRNHDRKVKEVWDWFEGEKTKLEGMDYKPGRLQREIAKAAYQRDLSLGLIHPVYEPHTLPNRLTIVISTTMEQPTTNPDLIVVRSPEEAIKFWQECGKGNLYVAGGAKLYEAFWDKMDLCHVTLVENTDDGDTKFNFELQNHTWKLLARQIMRREDQSVSHTFHVFTKKR
jgi:dihydrofolate reductase